MKHLILLFLVLFPLSDGGGKVFAQRIDSMFAAVPQQVLPLLDKVGRLDMIDLYNSGLEAKVENVYGGQSTLTKLTDNYLSLQLTEVSTWQMMLLPAGHDTVAVCIHTVRAGGAQSRVLVYHKDWSPTKRVEIPVPSFRMLYRDDDALSLQQRKHLQTILRQVPVEAYWQEDEPVLTYRLSVEGLSREQAEAARQSCREVSYRWASGKFQPAEYMEL